MILTKMMRGEDAQDMEDIRFLIEAEGLTLELMEPAFAAVRIPVVEELEANFRRALPHALRLLASRL